MEILFLIGVIFLGLIVFVFGGLLGWGIQGISEITGFLFQGCGNSIGCLVFIVIAIFCLLAVL